jgi:ADP-ribose pyrophosphatase YjhB (NUDIX family)
MYKAIVWVILKQDNNVLLLKKPDNSEWTLTGGHVEDQESLKMAAIRIAKQQINLDIESEDLDFSCVIDRKMDSAFKLHIFFKVSKWQGELNNNEPNVHSEVEWCNLDSLPENLGILADAAINSLTSGDLYYFKDEPEAHNKH